MQGIKRVVNARQTRSETAEARDEERIGRLAVDLGLSDRVVFNGHVSRQSIPESGHLWCWRKLLTRRLKTWPPIRLPFIFVCERYVAYSKTVSTTFFVDNAVLQQQTDSK